MHLLTCLHFEKKTNPVGQRFKVLVTPCYQLAENQPVQSTRDLDMVAARCLGRSGQRGKAAETRLKNARA